MTIDKQKHTKGQRSGGVGFLAQRNKNSYMRIQQNRTATKSMFNSIASNNGESYRTEKKLNQSEKFDSKMPSPQQKQHYQSQDMLMKAAPEEMGLEIPMFQHKMNKFMNMTRDGFVNSVKRHRDRSLLSELLQRQGSESNRTNSPSPNKSDDQIYLQRQDIVNDSFKIKPNTAFFNNRMRS